MSRVLRVCRLALILLPLGLSPAFAQSTDQTSPADNNWASGCTASTRSGPLDCSAAQQVIDANTGRLRALLRVRVPGDTKSPVMLVQMPLGLYLPGQLTLSVDGAAATTVAFQTCDASGCYAGMEVTPTLLSTMLKGQTLTLQAQDQARESISVPIALAGFAKAYSQIQ